MKNKQMGFYGVILLLVMGVLTLGYQNYQASKKIQKYEVENIELNEVVVSQSELIASLNDQLLGTNEILLAQQDKVIIYDQLSAFIDFDDYEITQLERAQVISEDTPLDLEAATSLVKYADQYDISYSLILSIIDIESNFTEDLVGTHEDRGYMQIIPGTEKWLATAYGDELGLEYNPERIFEPSYNLALGIKYIDILMNAYGSNYERILSEYNRGPSKLQSYYKLNQTYSTGYSRLVLNKERKYVAYNF